jgi:hypothetical protein
MKGHEGQVVLKKIVVVAAVVKHVASGSDLFLFVSHDQYNI